MLVGRPDACGAGTSSSEAELLLFDKIANFFDKPDVRDPANNYQKIDGIGYPAAKFFMLFSTLKNNDVAA
jgi:hypothetical protein